MSLGFFLWLLIAVSIIGFFGWTVYIQQRQKDAWRSFAKKFDMNFTEGKFFETPSIEGFVKDRYVKLYESKELDRLGKPVAKITLEVELNEKPPCAIAITSKSQQYIFSTVKFETTLRLNDKNWDSSHLIGVSDETLARAYLTPLRLHRLNGFLMMKKAATFFISSQDRTFLMVQTTQPLDNAKLVHNLVKKLFALALILETNEGPKPATKKEPEKASGSDNNKSKK